MTDAIQASSSLPLPVYQTVSGSHDPLPPSSPQALTRSLDSKSASDAGAAKDNFADYLDRTTITMLEKNQTKQNFDPASLITQGSVYVAPDSLRPI